MKLLTDYFVVKNNLQNPDKPIVSNGKPTKQQSAVINASLSSNLSIIACAGSGKTTTLINRIEYLIKNGVNAGSIILTTFTRDSAKDMTKKLQKKLGNVNMFVGTMDSLSLHFLRQFNLLDEQLLNVGEYAVHFLDFLQNHDDRKIFFSQFKYLIVDEFQDINELQYNIINQFYKNGIYIIGVGDDGQNIYTFRGSNIEYIVNYKKYFGGKIFYLTNNFRSTNQIINVANYTIEKAQYILPKKMVAQSGYNGEKPKVNFFYNQEEQANYIIAQIRSYYKMLKKYDEICILAPMNATLYKLEELALQNGLPVNLLDNKEDGLSCGIKRGKITLCTIHKSKGLEWDVVFVIGMNDEMFPPEKSADKIEESRRLFYVATTRARKFLHYSFTPINGSKIVSRFIGEIPKDLVSWTGFQKEFLGESVETHIKDKNGVVEKIQSLQIPDIEYLRKKKIISELPEMEVIDLHSPNRLPKWAEDNNLQKDFGIYLDTIICRELAIKCGMKITNYSCLGCISMVNVDLKMYKSYVENIGLIRQFLVNGDMNLFATIDNEARKVVEMMIKNAKTYGIKPENIAVHPQNGKQILKRVICVLLIRRIILMILQRIYGM